MISSEKCFLRSWDSKWAEAVPCAGSRTSQHVIVSPGGTCFESKKELKLGIGSDQDRPPVNVQPHLKKKL
jgi:hypothetical protein